LHPIKVRRLIFSDSGVLNAITQLILLNSIANRHLTVSPCVAAGRLVTVRTVIKLSYALVVGVRVTPNRYHPARRTCIGSPSSS
jgi:hypothetical protein